MPTDRGPNAQQQAFSLSGGYFVYTNVSTATLTVSGNDGYCHVEVGSAISQRVVSFSSNKTMSLAVSGPGGLHQDHVEAVSTVYVIYLAWKSATSPINGTADLFAVPSGTSITAAKLTALGAGYDHVSNPIGVVVNDAAGNILSFYQLDDYFHYNAQALNSGNANVLTPIDLTAFCPVEAKNILFRFYWWNTGSTYIYCRIEWSGILEIYVPTRLTINGVMRMQDMVDIVNLYNTLAYNWTTVLQYSFTALQAQAGLSVYVEACALEWSLPRMY